ncbi:MAG: GNAT family N-acetyltransferase [Oscillospiraceae bacterium]|nr:GNAT family N-acetyltransferase [Oscillospiraceae bacterium]
MCKISLADFSHRTELINLWGEAFGDDEKFISSFLDAYMIPEYNVPVVLEENGKIASVLYLIEFEFYSNTKILGYCAYLFAAATKKEYQNKGYMSKLIEYSAELCKNRGLKAVFLFPQGQNQKLFDFYSKFGFESIYGAKKIIVQTPVGFAASSFQKGAEFRLTDKDITDIDIFDWLYNSYAEFTLNQELAPLKDRLFYFKCAKSYLDVHENPEIEAHFAVFENNVEKFCYVFYKKYKNTYYIDDIIIPEYSKIKENTQKKYEETIKLLTDFIIALGDNINCEINIPPISCSDSQNISLAMILPLTDDIKNIINSIKIPVYINMFMNI